MLDARTKLFVVLAGVFSTSLVVGDIIGGKLIQPSLWGHPITLTVGMIPFPITFLLTDLLNEFYGKHAARFVTMLGFGLAVLAYIFIYLAAAIPIAPMATGPGWEGVTDAAFTNVFVGSQRMIVASLTAYLVAQFADIAVFHALKGMTGQRMLWLRASGSTVASQAIDTVTISLVAWWGLLPWRDIAAVMMSSYGVKLAIAIGLTPGIYALHALVQRFMGLEPVGLGATAEQLLSPLNSVLTSQDTQDVAEVRVDTREDGTPG